MSIAASNLFTRNVYTTFFRPDASPAEETRVSQLVSLLVKVGALVFVLGLDKTLAINMQLLGGIWIVQTFPSLGFGLYTRWFHRWALLAGWAVAMLYGTLTAYRQHSPAQAHFAQSIANVPLLHHSAYIALTAFVINMIVVVVLTPIFRAAGLPDGVDETRAADYTADAEDVREVPELVTE
jgi:SSS family solute:Na+ symporter